MVSISLRTAAIAALLLAAGCTSSAAPRHHATTPPSRSAPASTSAAPTSSAPSTDAPKANPPDCLKSLHPDGTILSGGLEVDTVGEGQDAIVLSNESDEDLCSWVPLARTLSGAGFEVALYDYTGDPVDDIAAAAKYLRSNDATTVTLLGASEGAKASIIAAAQVHPDGVISLSAEQNLQGTDVQPYAAKLSAPVLFVTAADDPFGATPATRGYYRAAKSKVKSLDVVHGQDHGTATLRDGDVAAQVYRLLDAVRTPPDSCGKGATAMWLPGPNGEALAANSLGSSQRIGVVFLHEIGGTGMCGFYDYAHWLTTHYPVRAVLIDRCGNQPTSCPKPLQGDTAIRAETAPAVDWLRAHGAGEVSLIGGSGGGADALQAAYAIPHIASVVNISGDVTDTGLSLDAVARRVSIPTLAAVAKQDPFCSLPTFRKAFALVPAQDKMQLIEPAGSGHGWDLVNFGSNASKTVALAVARWVTQH